LVGDGIDKLKLEKFAEEEGVKEHFVFFDGLLEGHQLVEKINTADFMILFSNYENLPVVILEALACGLPVLSTDVGGIAEHLNGERGLLTEAGNEDAFVEKLNKMLSDYIKYDAEKIREYAVNNFSNKVIGDSFSQIYSKILTGRK
jgi:glycosyltransferase involved in cell wall biosynthesis